MKKRFLLSLVCILILVLSVSCDAELRETIFGYMDKAGENVLAPEVTQNVDTVKDIVGNLTTTVTVDGLGDPEGEDGKYTQEQIDNISTTLDTIADDAKKDLVDSINKAASGDKKQQEALKEEMQKPIEDQVVVKVVQNTAESAKSDVSKALANLVPAENQAGLQEVLNSNNKEDIKKALESNLGDSMGEMGGVVAEVVSDIISSINDLATSDTVSQGDLVTAQLTVTLVTEILDVVTALNTEPGQDETTDGEQLVTGLDNETLFNLVSDVETLSNVGNATGANFNPLGNVNLGSILGMLGIGK